MIKAVIFDIGGVVQGVDWSFVVNSLIDIKEDLDIESYRSAFYHDREKYLHMYETSKISKQEFWGMVASRLGIDPKHIDLLSDSFELLYSFINNDIIDLVKQLKYSYKVFALANSCPELEHKMIKDNIYTHIFDKIYFSHRTGKRKPEKEAYSFIFEENRLQPEECILIDNDIGNIRAAREAGMHSLLVKDPTSLKKELFFILEKAKYPAKEDTPEGSHKIVGYTTGVFDLFHQGHLNLLKNAKAHCDKLIVGVTTDELSLSFKGKKPIMGFEERKEIVKSIKYVDEVVPQDSMDKFEAWKKYRFDVMFANQNMSPKWPDVEAEFLKKFEGTGITPPTIIKLPYTPRVSSTLRRELVAND